MYTYNYMSNYTNNYMSVYICIYIHFYSFVNVCDRLRSIKNCLCCFLDMHLYSTNLSTIATIGSIILSELFPACFSCNNYFTLSLNSSACSERNDFSENDFFETPEAETIKLGDSNTFIGVLSRVYLIP